MRQINKIILHCSDSDRKEDDDIKVINEWHLKRGFAGVGYHFFITKNGSIQVGRKLELPGAHVLNHNADSIGICLSGRKDFTTMQYNALKQLLLSLYADLRRVGNNNVVPSIHGHCEFDLHKTCPNFNYKQFINDFYAQA
ncbi:MAG: N-acetylmuramoyl-L-alanine amidase [Dehalococcoidia bacterium]|nr:MAG: N-acetylmuramoyl-L-alanine amidase [Dehalococcoidia bacterium]